MSFALAGFFKTGFSAFTIASMMYSCISGLPFGDYAQLPIDRANFQPLLFNALGIVINHGDLAALRQVHDFMDYATLHHEEDFPFALKTGDPFL
jgi:hypothetical protein